ncbi:hypothetical protein FNU76_01620 [Chitinimonas arctica]|uniref:Uncharacterized protein n=1 Tax=Chitinimonas arctica TaxID=2594795 RepID=A0A516SAI2_9NEIS|nr:hypothetical protein [Chitinimonas arctica]QDQ25159.1 hypothetical protein FNU76_01620 [Chitinimonas arctica]
MDWTPISETAIWEKILLAESRMNAEQSRLWEWIKILPSKWQQTPWGDEGGGFWVVGLIGDFVLWFNDVEDGFNISHYKIHGHIEEYWCNQDELEWAIQSILNAIQMGYAANKCGPPIAGEYAADT